MNIIPQNDPDLNGLDRDEDTPGGLLAPMTEGTRLAVAVLQAGIDGLSLRMSVAKMAGDRGLAADLQFQIHGLYRALAEQSRGFLGLADRKIADKLGEHETQSLKDEWWSGVIEDAAAEEVAGTAAFEADEVADAAASKLARAYKRITALEKLIATHTKGKRAKGKGKAAKRTKGDAK